MHAFSFHSVHSPRLYRAPSRRVRRNVEGIQDWGCVQLLTQLAACLVSIQSHSLSQERAYRHATNSLSHGEQLANKVGAYPLAAEVPSSPTIQPASAQEFSHYAEADSRLSEQRDPTYVPGNFPGSRRDMRETRQDPPLTRSRTKSALRDQLR